MKMSERISEVDKQKYIEKLSKNIEVIEFINGNFRDSYGKSLKSFLNPTNDYELNISNMLISYYSDICSLRGNARIICDVNNNITLKAIMDEYNGIDNEYAKVAKKGYSMIDSNDDESISRLAQLCVDSIVLAHHVNKMDFYFYLSDNSGIIVETVDDFKKIDNYMDKVSSTISSFTTISVVDFFRMQPYELDVNDDRFVKLTKFVQAFHEHAIKYMTSKVDSQKIRK